MVGTIVRRAFVIACPVLIIFVLCVGSVTNALADAESVAWAYLSANAADLSLPSNLAGIELDSAIVARGATHVHFRQTVEDDIVVFGVDINVSVNNQGQVCFVGSNYISDLSLTSYEPSITSSGAIAISDSLLGTDSTNVSTVRTLVAYRDTLGEDHLAWAFSVQGDSIEPSTVLIDAQSSEVIMCVSEVARYVDGAGKAFVPDPVTRSGDQSLNDSSDPPTQDVALPRLADAIGGMFRIRGSSVFPAKSDTLSVLVPLDGADVFWVPIVQSSSTFNFPKAHTAFEEVNAYFHMYTANSQLSSRGLISYGADDLPFHFDVHNAASNIFAGAYVFEPAKNGNPDRHTIRLDDNGNQPDGGEDPDFIVHEFYHLIQRLYLPEFFGGNVRKFNWQSGHMPSLQEGYSDYFAISYRRAAQESLSLCPPSFPDYIGSWYAQPSTNGLEYRRALQEDFHYPENYAPPPAPPHDNGGILWASTLIDIEEAIGREKALVAITESIGYLIGGGTMVLAAHGLLQAYVDNFPNDLGDAGQIARILANRGFIPMELGHPSSNTTWSGSRLIIGDVVVDEGDTLTIQGYAFTGSFEARQYGSVIAFAADSDSANLGFESDRSELIVRGGLEVKGAAGRRVLFTSGGKPPDDPVGSSCSFTLHPPEEGDWWGIYFSNYGAGGSGTINYADIRHSQWGVVSGSSQATTISNCTFADNELCDVKSSTGSTGLEITDCDIDIGGGIGMDLGSAKVVFDNELTGNADSDVGIICSPASGSDTTLITTNSVAGLELGTGISLQGDSIAVLVSNAIDDCQTGISIARGKHLIGTEDVDSDNTLTSNTTGIQALRSGPGSCPGSVPMEAHIRNTRLIGYSVGIETIKVAEDSIALVEMGTVAHSSGSVPDEGRNAFLGKSGIPAPVAIQNSSSCGTVLARGNYFGPNAGTISGAVDTTGPLATDPMSIGPRIQVEPVPPVKDLILLGVSPNPVSDSAAIIFEVSNDPIEVGASIFDVSGRLVWHMGPEIRESGRHSVTWGGRDDTGRLVSSGLFFLRLTRPGKSPIQSRIVVLR